PSPSAYAFLPPPSISPPTPPRASADARWLAPPRAFAGGDLPPLPRAHRPPRPRARLVVVIIIIVRSHRLAVFVLVEHRAGVVVAVVAPRRRKPRRRRSGRRWRDGRGCDRRGGV